MRWRRALAAAGQCLVWCADRTTAPLLVHYIVHSAAMLRCCDRVRVHAASACYVQA